MKAEDKIRAVAAWHEEWSRKWENSVTVDPLYADNYPSQYAETIIDMSASEEAQNEYWSRVFKIMGMKPLQRK